MLYVGTKEEQRKKGREYRHKNFEDVLTEMVIDLQDETSE